MLRLTSHPDDSVTWELLAPAVTEDSVTGERTFRPTWYMEQVSRYLELADEPASKNTVEKAIQGKARYVRDALALLVPRRPSGATFRATATAFSTARRSPYRAPSPDPVPTSSRERGQVLDELFRLHLVPSPVGTTNRSLVLVVGAGLASRSVWTSRAPVHLRAHLDSGGLGIILRWHPAHASCHEEVRWADPVLDLLWWLELERPSCIRQDEGSPLWNEAVDANRLEFLVLGTTDPFLEMAGLGRVETVTYTLHAACGFS